MAANALPNGPRAMGYREGGLKVLGRLRSAIRSVSIACGIICIGCTLAQCSPQRDQATSQPEASSSGPHDDVQAAGAVGKAPVLNDQHGDESTEEAPSSYEHSIKSELDGQQAAQCYEAFHAENTDVPSPAESPKSYSISVMEDTGIRTIHIKYRAAVGWEYGVCDFGPRGYLQLKFDYASKTFPEIDEISKQIGDLEADTLCGPVSSYEYDGKNEILSRNLLATISSLPKPQQSQARRYAKRMSEKQRALRLGGAGATSCLAYRVRP